MLTIETTAAIHFKGNAEGGYIPPWILLGNAAWVSCELQGLQTLFVVPDDRWRSITYVRNFTSAYNDKVRVLSAGGTGFHLKIYCLFQML